MRGRWIQLLIKVIVVAALVWVGRRALIRWVNGPEEIPSPEPWPPIEAVATGRPADGREGPAEALGGVAGAADTPAVAAGLAVSDPPTVPHAAPAPGPVAAQPGAPWLPPDESGACPPTHPVKAKRSSKLYREPGAAAYDRSRPDRCYVSAEAAEADGFTRAKR